MFKKIIHRINQGITATGSLFSLNSDNVSFALLGLLVGLGSLVIIPIRFFPVIASKGIFITSIATVLVIIAMVHTLRIGSVTIPKLSIFSVLAFILGAGLLGSFFAPSFAMSFFGYGFEVTTWVFTAVFAVLITTAYFTIRSYERLTLIYGAFLLGTSVVIIVQLLRFFLGVDFLNLGVLFTTTSSLVGNFNDLALLLGFTVVLSVITLELAPFVKSIKYLLGLLGGLSFLLLVVMNASEVLMVVGFVLLVTALVLFSFAYWDNQEHAYSKSRKIPWVTFAFFIITLVALFGAPIIHQKINTYQNISSTNIRPSAALTMRSFFESTKHNPIVGYGANTFSGIWSQVKPVSLSGNNLGSLDFSVGSGYVPTMIASQGPLGLIGWVGLFALLLISFFKRIKQGFQTSLERYLSLTLIVTGFYMTAIMWVNVPNAYMLALAGILFGSYFGISTLHKKNTEKTFSFIQDPRASFFGVLIITALIIASLVGGYVIIRKTSSLKHYVQGMTALGQNNQDQGVSKITRAFQLAGHDVYAVRLAELYNTRTSRLISQVTEQNKEAVSRQIEQSTGLALGYINQAIAWNPINYQHHILLGSIYQSMALLGVTDASDRAVASFTKAESLNPQDATMKLLFANLALVQNNRTDAQKFVDESLGIYPTADALLVQTRIAIAESNWKKAADSLEAVVAVNPNNVALIINLGVIQEKAGNQVRANQIFNAIKNRFADGAQAIDEVRKSFGINSIPETLDTESEEPVVAQ